MIVQVHMLAFYELGVVRDVEIADDTPADGVLDEVFKYGQNDFQPGVTASVSTGDVIELPDGSLWRVDIVGFSPMTLDEFKAYRELSRVQRFFWKGVFR